MQTLVAFALVASAVVAQGEVTSPPRVRKAEHVQCDTTDACFPYSPRGPYCSRGNNINFRFQLQLAPENYREDPGLPDPISNVTYAFCPRVDELKAFNFSRVGELSLTYLNGTTYDAVYNQTYDNLQIASLEQVYLSVIGFGDTRNIAFPQPGSAGRVMIADYTIEACEFVGEFGLVSFLSLNVSMEDGRFKYPNGGGQPGGVGFVPSCDEYDVCVYNSSMRCFGEPGMKNCGTCVSDIYKLYDFNVQVWTSYYGTDARGRQLRSGATNPLNFQAFSGSGVAGAMSRSYSNIEDGRTIGDDELTPPDNRRQTAAEIEADEFFDLVKP